MPQISIVIVEDLEEIVETISLYIQADPELRLLDTFSNAEAALQTLPILNPDIVIMDINLPGMSGIDCVREIKLKVPSIQFMMFTVYENNDLVFEALKAGASGYLLKKTNPLQIIEAIKEMQQGGAPMSATIARKLVNLFVSEHPLPALSPDAASLTNREREVLELLAKGFIYKEIAKDLQISFHTVKEHIRKIYDKLYVNNKTEAINKVFGNPK